MAKNLVFMVLGLFAMPALASCPQDAVERGSLIGQTYCDVTKEAFAGSVAIRSNHLSFGGRCSNGSPFSYRDVLFCRRVMAKEVSRDFFCNKIYRSNSVLNFGHAFHGPRSAASVFAEFQRGCAAGE